MNGVFAINKNKIIWLTGLSGSGKSTLANHLVKALSHKYQNIFIIDGDQLRQQYENFEFDDDARRKQMERAIKLAKDKLDNGFFVIVSLISPFKSLRDRAKEIVGPQNLVEVYVNTPLNICEERDTKGLYKKARAGLIKYMTGIDSIYESPQNPDIVIDTVSNTIDDCVKQITKFIS